MKWTLCLLCVASVATALPSTGRDKKGFSLFSVVTFPNAECTTNSVPARTGICVTAEECSSSGDVTAMADGNCASGFGVCCMRRVEGNPNAAITSGLTYIQSPDFPGPVAALNPAAAAAGQPAAVNRAFNIMGGSNICQIRFDFVVGQFMPPTVAGVCNQDMVNIITPTQTAMEVGAVALCGTLTGQHLIVNVDRTMNSAMAATLNINHAAGFAGQRMWQILAKCVECDSDDLAPPGCLQYFTDRAGRISSFNGAAAVAGNAHQLIGTTRYAICFRQQPGFCGVTLMQARSTPGDVPDAFLFPVATAANAAKSGSNTECTSNYIDIIKGTVTDGNGAAKLPSRLCGAILNPKDAQTADAPAETNGFRINVVTDTAGFATAASGFDINYTLRACP